jgi:hypothetical protein
MLNQGLGASNSPHRGTRSSTDSSSLALLAAVRKGIERGQIDHWESFRQALSLLDRDDQAGNGLILDQNLYTLPLLHSLILRNVPLDLFARVLDLGADLDIKVTQHNGANRDRYFQCSPVEMALLDGRLEHASLLIDRGCNRHRALELSVTLDKDEEKPLRTELLLSRGEKLASLTDGVLHGANLRGLRLVEDLKGRDLSDANLIGTDLSMTEISNSTLLSGAVRSPTTRFPDDFNYRDPELRLTNARPHPIVGTDDFLSARDVERMYVHLTNNPELPGLIAQEAKKFHQRSGDLSDAVLYLLAYNDTVANYPNGTGLPLTSLLPRILFGHTDIAIPELLRSLERKMDTFFSRSAGYHYNMPELLALCAHPRDPGLQSPLLDTLATAITSVDRWIGGPNLDVQLTNEVMALWGKTGILTHSFPWLKYATQRERTIADDGSAIIRPAIIESFGGRFVPDNETRLGHRYVFSPGTISFSTDKPDMLGERGTSRTFRSEIFVELRRGYYLVSDPEHGTLIIRNSSPDFGRDRLPDVAFWSPRGIDNGLSEDALLGFNLNSLHSSLLEEGGFRHITDPSLYRKSSEAPGHMRVLEQNLLDLIDHFHRWTFDTSSTAWKASPDGGDPMLVGGHLSAGFGHVLDFLETRKRANLEKSWAGQSLAPLPALAVMPRELPWWAPYPLTPALGGRSSEYQIPVSLPVIEALRALHEGEVDHTTPDDTGVLNLLQRAIDKRAVLALVDRAEMW